MSKTVSFCRRSGGILSIPLVVSLSILASSSAFAQLEEIVVTASKREESLQDAPMAVSAFTGNQLDRQGVNDAIGLNNVVPNLNIATEGARDAVFINIRGISQTERRNAADPTTAFYVDGAYVPRMSGINAYFYDVERVEVLRGPQGTLYGRNSTSGVVNVITNKPDTEAVGGNIDVTLGNYNWAQFRGALNIPFSDTVAARFAFVRNSRDGYRDNAPAEDGDDADDLGVRGHLAWNIGEDTDLLLSADYYQRKGVGTISSTIACPPPCTTQNIVSPDPADTHPLNTTGFRDNSDTNFKLELNHDFSGVRMDFIGSWRKHERDFFIDNDSSGASIFLPATGAVTPISSILQEVTESKTFSGELRLTSTNDGPIQWIVGGFYMDETINGDFDVQPMNGNGSHLTVQFVDKDFTVESKALFANVSFDINDSWSVNGGIRYTEDDKDKGGFNDPANPTRGSYQRVGIVESGNPVAPIFPRAQVANPSWEKTTWKIGMDWRVSDDALAYATVSTGYKSGGFNRGSNDPKNPSGSPRVNNLIVYNPEELTAFEVGYKSTFADGRGRANVAACYYDFAGSQQAVVVTIDGILVNTTINAADATIWGGELESSYVYGDSGGQIDFNLGYLNTEFDKFIGLDDPLTPIQDNLDLSGTRMINAPEWNFTVSWTPAVWDVWGGTMTPLLSIHYESDYFSFLPQTRPAHQQSSFTRSNANLHWESNDGGVWGEIFVNNIEDEDIVTRSGCGNLVQGSVSNGLPGGVGCSHMFAPPRTYGARLGYRF